MATFCANAGSSFYEARCKVKVSNIVTERKPGCVLSGDRVARDQGAGAEHNAEAKLIGIGFVHLNLLVLQSCCPL